MRIGEVVCVQFDYGLGNRDSHRMYWSGAMRHASRLSGKVSQTQLSDSFVSMNQFFADSLNAQEFDGVDITHLVGMHNDVIPEYGWLDILIDEMEITGADLLGVILPIKDNRGVTGTAIDSGNEFEVERRLTMKEVWRLPPTFTSVDCGYQDRTLLCGLALWIMDFTKPWRLLTNPDGSLSLVCTSPDRIARRRKDGRWEAQHACADWHISRHLNRVGAKVMATRKVLADHAGEKRWNNGGPWGEWDADESLRHNFGERRTGDGPSQGSSAADATFPAPM